MIFESDCKAKRVNLCSLVLGGMLIKEAFKDYFEICLLFMAQEYVYIYIYIFKYFVYIFL